ncbi:choline transporter [Corynebacterium sp. HMSC11H10]|uniref:Choline BCCT transporter BetT n=2 Tax=Corynebacteriaceae TaxID=1653 RepID=A0AB38XVW4_CORAY|nr:MULTISPECIES: choline BCCT transporter BetT [Corynebacterium]AIN82145.1 transporter, betaine/carnitine/choline transporter family protein [Corynebacterium sp. ATCC 6931]KAA9288176.1 BCCT family transporter [Corynebacterium amycolatum]MBC6725784.1 high-affinity choline transporter BetT [Corynebacterium amycolatum]MDY7342670.1 choline BCCT transporter BetT [Corynebacterium amycolatum]OFU55335.1 choline transporter [Corynebacterium sp. HMSC11H10]
MSDTPPTEKVTEEKSESSQEMQRSQSVPPQQAQASATSEPEVNWPVFIISGVGILAIALWAIFAPDNAAGTLAGIVAWVSKNFGWFYIVTATVAVLFMLYVAISRTGQIKLGPDHAKPQFGLFSWASMLFAAGIGIDLLFFSVAEPVAQYYGPPTGDAETIEAARQAVVFTLFHYGVTGWALYALMGMAFGYFAYRLNMPLTIRSALYPIIGKRIHGPAGEAVEIAAMLGTIFGVATSLGIGVVQLNYGLRVLFGVDESTSWQIALIVVAVSVAIASAVSGVDKGIRRLSELNVGLAICLMLYILITGRTAFLFDALVMNVGEYVSKFPSMTMDTYAFSGAQEWLNSWTLFFWAWWVAWAPFVGLFLARISRGRSLRQFVVGTLTIPFLFVLMWVSVFGNSALDLVINGDSEFGQTALDYPERAFYLLLEQYPAPMMVAAVASLIGLLLYITSADSAALVMSNFTSKITDTQQDGKKWTRIFWAVVVGVLTISMLYVGGIPTLQSATIVMGLPFAFVIYLVMYGLFKSLRLELLQQDSTRRALHGAMSGRAVDGRQGDWRNRLARSMSFPGKKPVMRYLDRVVQPALEQVADAIRERGGEVTLHREPAEEVGIDQIDLQVGFGEEMSFRYQVYPVEHLTPSFAGLVHLDSDADIYYYRLEVFTLTGSLGYDVYGYTQEQLISDVLDLYERHLEFLHMQADLPGTSDLSDNAEPVREWSDDYAKEDS